MIKRGAVIRLSGKIRNIKLLGYLKIFNLYVRICTTFGLRPRYLFTRENKLRLRYIAYIWVAVFDFSAGHQAVTSQPEARPVFSSTATIAHMNPAHLDNDLRQRDVKGHSKIASESSKGIYVASLKYEEGAKNTTGSPAITHLEGLDLNTELNLKKLEEIKFDSYVQIVSKTFEKELEERNKALKARAEKLKASQDKDKIKLASADLSSQAIIQNNLKKDGREENALENGNSVKTESINAGFINASYKIGGLPVPPMPSFNEESLAKTQSFKVRKGDTFANILHEAGISREEAHSLIKAVSKEFDPRYLKVGQKMYFEFRNNRLGKVELAKLSMPLEGLRTLAVRQSSYRNFETGIEKLDLKPQLRARNITIQTSLYGSAHKQGISQEVIDKVLRIYAWDVDFQRDLRKGDRLKILYEALVDDDGETIAYGNLKYASLSVQGKEIPVYRFKTKDGRMDYFEPNGHSVRKTLMMTPIDGGRISSKFGMRHHPILGYSKMHKGVDFAAPVGTPVYAAGEGKVERFGRYGAYGNYIRLRHNRHLKTAYAHLKGFKSGLRKGQEVKQGDIIGYLGNTGRSTGPHLHYEVLVNGKQVNPGSLDLPTGTILTGAELDRFKQTIEEHRKNYAFYLDEAKYAFAGGDITAN